MNCEWCQTRINDYVDGVLNETDCIRLEKHLETCAPCAFLHEDLSAMLHCCLEVRNAPDAPPNAQALWLRISNLIESEQSALVAKESQLQPAAPAGAVSRWLNQSWQLSFQQMASAVLATVVVTALVTVVAFQQQNLTQASPQLSSGINQQGLMPQIWSNFGYQTATEKQPARGVYESRLKDQQVAIEYWQQRVEQRKRQWNQHLREAFDRNVRELDAVVAEYEQQLEHNPHDDVSEEMLDSAINDKMALLREFSEL